MTLQILNGQGLILDPSVTHIYGTPGFAAFGPIDATGEKLAFVGRVFFPSRTGTKNISRVQFRFGTVTKTGGSALTLSLQDVSLTSGPPGQPDGIQDQTVAIPNADIVTGWYRTGTLSSERTVSYGDLLAIVVEFDANGRLGSDAINLSIVNRSYANFQTSHCSLLLYTTSWAIFDNYNIPNVLLEFSDGTFGTLVGADVASNISYVNINSDSSPDEVALKFKFPFKCKIDGVIMNYYAVASADFNIVLYNASGTALVTVSVDANTLVTSNYRLLIVNFSEQTIEANTNYYLAVKPTTTNTGGIAYIDVDNANHMSVLPGGTNCYWSQRTDAGAWSDTTTRRPLISPIISSLSDDAGGGGTGGISRARVQGGM